MSELTKKASSLEETAALGEALGRVAQAGDCLGLKGELGAGKTYWVQAMARGLELPPGVRVTSPTFTLLNEYRGGRLTLFHADLYRIEKESELLELGMDDVPDAGGVFCVEWYDRFPVLPMDALFVSIEGSGDMPRTFNLRAAGAQSEAWLERFTAASSA